MSGTHFKGPVHSANGFVGNVTGAVTYTAVTVTATTGTLPTANGSVTIANAATPTVGELLELCMELKAKLDGLAAQLD